MMNKWIAYIFAGLLLCLSLYVYFSESPSDIVLKKMDELAADLSVRQGETPLDQLKRTHAVVKKFNEKFEIIFKVDGYQKPPITDSIELKRTLLFVRKWVKRSSVRFINIKFLESSDDLIIVRGKIQWDSYKRGTEESEIEFQFSRFTRDWLITRVETFNSFDSSGKWKH